MSEQESTQNNTEVCTGRLGRFEIWFMARLGPITCAFAVFAVATIATSAAAIGQKKASARDISALLETERAKHALPAVAAVVIKKDRIVARGVAGVRKLGDDTKAGLDDRWHLGSDTKAITATMIGVLVERGVMKWETKIKEALPDLAESIRADYADVTVEMLLAHRGGIRHESEVPGLWATLWKREGTPVEERRKMAKVMLTQEPKVAPGEYFYANCGYGIAGHMAETITGKPWEQLMRELVFEPLGMNSAGFGVPWEDEPPTDPWPHSSSGVFLSPGAFADNPPSIGPGATVHASLDDWAKFVIDHLHGLRSRKSVLLKAATYRRLHRGQKTGEAGAYALGWMVLERDWAKSKSGRGKGRCLHHAGSNNSWFALVWIAPKRDLAVLTVTNIGGSGIFPKIDAVNWAVIQDHLKRSGG
ncbi:MAG: beta-lactamase family protein [Planctomycetes bacterium]|nr:beta-lactamase family protein [Planctomycetota bacterium]